MGLNGIGRGRRGSSCRRQGGQQCLVPHLVELSVQGVAGLHRFHRCQTVPGLLVCLSVPGAGFAHFLLQLEDVGFGNIIVATGHPFSEFLLVPYTGTLPRCTTGSRAALRARYTHTLLLLITQTLPLALSLTLGTL